MLQFLFLPALSQPAPAWRAGRTRQRNLLHQLFNLGPDGEVEIGNFCTLVGAIISTNARVVIGDYAFLAHEVVLADSFVAKPHPLGSDTGSGGESPAKPAAIIVGRNSWIGARAVLLAGAVIGEGAVVGAAAVVDFEVPPFATVAGNPARIVS